MSSVDPASTRSKQYRLCFSKAFEYIFCIKQPQSPILHGGVIHKVFSLCGPSSFTFILHVIDFPAGFLAAGAAFTEFRFTERANTLSTRAVHEKGDTTSVTFDYLMAHTHFSDLMSTFSWDMHLNSCVLHPLQDKTHSMSEGRGKKKKTFYLNIREIIICS